MKAEETDLYQIYCEHVKCFYTIKGM